MCEGSKEMAPCYPRVVKGQLPRLVCFTLIAVLGGSPAFAAVCAELCGLKAAPAPTSAHCSKHAAALTAETRDPSAHHAMPAAPHHGVWHQGDEELVAVTVGHGPGCCGGVTVPIAVATKLSRPDGASNPPVAPSPPYLSVPIARAGMHVLPPGLSGFPALSRAPLVLRI